MYLIDELPMRYDVNLFQFIANIMEVMCLVHEYMKCPVGLLKSTARIGSNNKRNWNMQQHAGKVFRSKAIVGH